MNVGWIINSTSLCLLLTACATEKQCVQWDRSAAPTMVTIPVGNFTVTQPVYPCVREQ